MNNDLASQKEKVRYWSKISAFLLTLLLPALRWLKKENPFLENPTEDWNQASGKEKALVVGICLILLLISYYSNYYVISSVFWPASLSVMNWILLVPGGIGTVMEIKEIGKMLLVK